MGSAELDTFADLRDLAVRMSEDDSLVQVRDALRAGQSGTIDGVWGSSKAMALAALAESNPPLLVVVLPHFSDVDRAVDDLRTFGVTAPMVLPALESSCGSAGDGSLAAHESFGRRLAVLKAVAGPAPPKVLVTTMQALLQPVPLPSRVAKYSRILEPGGTLDVEGLIRWLVENGWRRRNAVELPGEFSLRGGILDLFPLDADDPVRVELFGDEIESLRRFAVDSQRSLHEIPRFEITALPDDDWTKSPTKISDEEGTGHLSTCVPAGTWFALVEPIELKDEGRNYLNRLEDTRGAFSVQRCWEFLLQHPTVVVSGMPFPSLETTCSLRIESVERFSGEVNKLRDELDRTVVRDQLMIACHNAAEVERLNEVLADSEVARSGRLTLTVGRLAQGFRWVSAEVVAISDDQLLRRTDIHRPASRRRFQGRAIDSFLELHNGDYVVHLAHGIGMFRGMKMLDKNGQAEEHLTIEFADKVLVYVPASKIELVQAYVGSSQSAPRLSKVGGLAWERKKRIVQRKVQDLASDLIDVQAAREAQPGVAYPPDSDWQREFEASFIYVETDDQVAALQDMRHDLESARPMDRLLCGDVGFGKTELAIRAAFKVADFGKQVAVLVPTTVLAQQHGRTFRDRMAEFPFVVETISRFQTRAEQRDIIKRTAAGGVDVLIGTHRLVSPDVAFHDLGLVIIDEEQRFGVTHKEWLKKLRTQVDVVTMTATPIPRTLHSALLGIRDISNLETPPEDRLAVETRIARFDEGMIRHAVLRELNRDGQVFFVHNRVRDIHRVAHRLNKIVPEARIAVIHGQMPEHEIEEGMLAFLERRADVLLATTIIESGLDIPNANTIFINEGDRYGLADLHQLRGRVGRSARRAYCYVVIDELKSIKPDAQRRLKAIEEYSALGSGFQIALRDLEIRGVGNILGTEQSGHISAVGYELYCHLLENSVRALKKQPLRTILDVTIELPWQAYFPHEYLPGERFRIDAYRRLARIRNLDDLTEFRKDLEDRSGPIPQVGENLIDLAELRILAHVWQIESIRPDDEGSLVLMYRNRRRAETLEKLRRRAFFIVDARSAYIRVSRDQHHARGYCNVLKRILQPV